MAKVFLNSKVLIQQAVKDLLSKRYLLELGAAAAEMIRLRTRLGFGVDQPGVPRTKLQALAESTKAQRKRLKKSGKLNANTSPTKSNLTRTGQLISSIGVLNVAGVVVSVGASGTRDDGKRNEDIAEYAGRGSAKMNRPPRPFVSLSNVEQKRLREMVRKDLSEKLKRALGKGKR